MKFSLLFIFAAVLISTHAYERTWSKGDTLSYGIWTQNNELYIIMFFDSTNTDATYSKIVANNEASQQPNGASQLNQWNLARRIPKQSLLLEDRCSWLYNQNLMLKIVQNWIHLIKNLFNNIRYLNLCNNKTIQQK